MEIHDLIEKEFKVPTVKMTKELGRRMTQQGEKLGLFNRVRKYKQLLNR